jgi:DNA-3-methyladenine glycosylase II
MIIEANGAFDFKQSYRYMAEQDDCLYEVQDGRVRKAECIAGKKVLFELSDAANGVCVTTLLNEGVSEEQLVQYVEEWLDLNYDLEAFYQNVSQDRRISPYMHQLYGFRMVSYIEVSNAFLWAVLGQQITMSFAYILKRRVVEYFDHHIMFNGVKYLMMPSAGEIASLSIETFREMQVSTRKAEYLKGIMSYISEGVLSKENLLQYQSYDEVLKFLVSFRGVGPWSANTVLMRSLKYRNAIPIGDAGLKNVLKEIDDIDKPSIQYVEEEMKQYGDYGMYATVYLWEILKLLKT